MVNFKRNNHPIIDVINNDKIKTVIDDYEKRQNLLNSVKRRFKMNIYEELKSANIDLGCHYSDLYARVTPESKAIVEKYEHRPSVRTFRSQIDGHLWYYIPFAYEPYWDAKN